MPRRERLHFPGAFYHITLRGNNRKTIFYNDKNRCRFSLLLQEGVERYGHSIHAFCLMDNHVHLLVKAANTPISKAIQNFAFRYTRYLNNKNKSVGHQLHNRFHARLIQNDEYLIQVVKYIHLNPVKAKMTSKPENYYWSSHNCYTREDYIPWVETNFVHSLFSNDTTMAIRKYKQFVNQQFEENIINTIENPKSSGRIIGSDEFAQEVTQKNNIEDIFKRINIQTILKEVSHELDLSTDIILSKNKSLESSYARGLLAYFILEFKHLKLKDLGRLTQKSSATLSKQAKRISKLYKTDQNVAKNILNIRVKLGLRLTS